MTIFDGVMSRGAGGSSTIGAVGTTDDEKLVNDLFYPYSSKAAYKVGEPVFFDTTLTASKYGATSYSRLDNAVTDTGATVSYFGANLNMTAGTE